MAARLVDEPWNLSLDQIGRLTQRQVRHIYFHSRDDKGQLDFDEPTILLSPKEKFIKRFAAYGIPAEAIETGWQKIISKKKDRRPAPAQAGVKNGR